jgi:transcriptional regulator with XRE-family HTH domain
MEGKGRARLADELRAARARLRITQEELASRAGLSSATIFRLENGRRDIKAAQLIAIARVLGVRAADLLPDDEAAAGDAV